MKLIRIVVSDLHLGTGSRKGEINPFEGFHSDEEFCELVAHYDELMGSETEIELILNGDIFDLLKVKIDGGWPTEITPELAAEKLRLCLEGHPKFVHGLREFLFKSKRRLVYLPGNHDLDVWFTSAQDVFRRYVAPGPLAEKVRFITANDTYYLPEGIQIRHGHQLERIHRVDYKRMTRKRQDGAELLELPWGSLWMLQVMNPAKEERPYVDHIQPFSRFLMGALLFDTRFAFGFLMKSFFHFMKHRFFTIRAWTERLRNLPNLLREEILALQSFDDSAVRALKKLRGVHTLIVGHSHRPRLRKVDETRLLVNTGTWIRMINLDLEYLGQDSGLTYALIEYTAEVKPVVSLMRWQGARKAHELGAN